MTEETHLSVLTAKIEELKQEIEDKQRHIDLLKDGISDAKKVVAIYERTLNKRKPK